MTLYGVPVEYWVCLLIVWCAFLWLWHEFDLQKRENRALDTALSRQPPALPAREDAPMASENLEMDIGPTNHLLSLDCSWQDPAYASQAEVLRQLAGRIRMLRDAQGWTQEQFAERATMQRSYLADLELGRRNPSVRTLVKVANAFGVPVRELFEEIKRGRQTRA
jgi:DNA-binding XRE family transcriptional regulator